MVIIFFGAMVATINPRIVVLKLVGYVSAIGAAFWGLFMSAALEAINVKALYTPGWFPPCKVGKVAWPLGLRLDEWFPSHFSPNGICGEDSQWLFLGISMTQWLMLIYMAMISGLVMMLASWALSVARRNKPPTNQAG
jgi:disulfide bond formation protein DsbB